MTEHSHRNLVSSNLIRDLRAATTACESCTIRPFDEALSLALMSPIPTATTVHPPTREWKEILVKHKLKTSNVCKHKFCIMSCFSAHLFWLLLTSNNMQLVYVLQNSFLPKRQVVKRLLNCGHLRDWVKNAAVVPAQAEKSGWTIMSFSSWSLTSSGIFRLPELLLSKHQKEDILENSDSNFIQHNHSFSSWTKHFKLIIHKHLPQCQLIPAITTRKQKKKFLIGVFSCTLKITGCF